MGGQHSTQQTNSRAFSPSIHRRRKTSKKPPELNNNNHDVTMVESERLNEKGDGDMTNNNLYASGIGQEDTGQADNTGGYHVTYSTDNEVSTPKELTELFLESVSAASPPLVVRVMCETATRLHIKVFDPNIVSLSTNNAEFKKAHHPQYSIDYREKPFGIIVRRKTTGYPLFDSSHGRRLGYRGERLSITSAVTSRYMYALSTVQNGLLIDSMCQDYQFPPAGRSHQAHSCHPFFVALEEDGNSHGLFLCSSPMPEISLRQGNPSSLTYHSCGAFLDLYIFSGHSPLEVVQQYQDVVGRSLIPPYWALGFHRCIRGCRSAAELNHVIEGQRKSLMPYESQWTDIDTDRELGSEARETLSATVRNLHENGQRYMPIIVVGATYPSCDVCKCPFKYWWDMIHQVHRDIPFDGLCLEIEDVSGSSSTKIHPKLPHQTRTCSQHTWSLQRWEVNAMSRNKEHTHSAAHRDSHGSSDERDSGATPETPPRQTGSGKRILLMSTSALAGVGGHAGHCVRHITSFTDLRHSISVVLVSSMLGISLVGTDIAGFCPQELFIRWFQVAAFFPFLRSLSTSSLPPVRESSNSRVDREEMMRDLVAIRYSLLPYLYTLFYESHLLGTPVVRPLLMLYPKDKNTYSVDDQFMWGSSILFSPCLSQGCSSVSAYFPFDIWYDFYTGYRLTKVGAIIQLPAQLNHTNIHIRGGSIIVTQTPGFTTRSSHSKPFGLLAALDSNHAANGKLYWDDGEVLNARETGSYNLVKFNIEKCCLMSQVEKHGYPHCNMHLKLVQILGLFVSPERVTVNGLPTSFSFTDQRVLELDQLEVSLQSPLIIKW